MKKINKTVVISLILFLSTIAIFTIFENRKLVNKYEKLNCNTANMRIENTLLKEGFFHSYDYETISIDLSRYVSNSQQDQYCLRNLLQDKKTLVLFIHVESCNNCTFENITRIKKLRKNADYNVAIFVEGINMRKFQAFVKNNDIEDFAYLLPNRFFRGFNINPVVYFVIDETLKSRYFFAPSNIYPGLIQDYFDKLDRIL